MSEKNLQEYDKARLARWFTYHPPTEEQKPKYTELRHAEARCQTRIELVGPRDQSDPVSATVLAAINEDYRALAEAIVAHSPESADKSAALRCVRLGRMALNELYMGSSSVPAAELRRIAAEQTLLARWQASAAIACGGA